MLQQQINQIAQAVDAKLSESNKNVQEQFKHSAEIVKNVTEKLTKLDETNRQVVGFADQLKSLQDILKSKAKGYLGRVLSRNRSKKCFAARIISDAIWFLQWRDSRRGCLCG
jgi:DNA anti-recombination protein RmuC